MKIGLGKAIENEEKVESINLISERTRIDASGRRKTIVHEYFTWYRLVVETRFDRHRKSLLGVMKQCRQLTGSIGLELS